MKRTAAPQGFSLLEAILATAIFVGSIAIIGQLIDLGLAATKSNKLATVALLHAESKLAELELGMEKLESSTEPQPITDDPAWKWKLEVMPSEMMGLATATVTLEHRATSADEEPDYSLSLSRFMSFRPEASAEEESGDRVPVTIRELLGLSGGRPPGGAP